MKNAYISIVAGMWFAFSTAAFGQVTGRVQHFKNASKPMGTPISGLAQIGVRVYDTQGQLIGATRTDASGAYFLKLPTGQRVRVEFDGWPVGFSPAPGQTSVQFVTSPADANLSLWQPGQYTGSRPRAVQTLFTSNGMNGDSLPALASFSTGNSVDQQISNLAISAQAGNLWGLAYDRVGKRLFAAAFAKRHSGFGPLGAGGIYSMDQQRPMLSPFVNLSELGIPVAPANLNRDLPTQATDKRANRFSHDSLMFSLVGKIGLGGLDVSDDGRQLWVMNLFDRKLYRITLAADGHQPTVNDVVGYSIPTSGYRRGEARPFAVKFYAGKVYVGVINDATKKGTTDDLTANVLAFDPSLEKFETVFSAPLAYKRGNLDYGISSWHPWTDDYQKVLLSKAQSSANSEALSMGWMIYPQPIVSDIEFDTDGSMILGLMDRLGHQTGEGQYYRPKGRQQLQQVRGLAGGDVLRVAYIPDGRGKKRYQLEQNGQAGDRRTAGQGNGEGPNGGEFYFEDSFKADNITWHHETAAGGLALLPDQDQLLVASREPETGGYLGGGVKWFNNRTGAADKGISLLPKGQVNPFGKANNVGDVELISEAPPTEIGDRIWLDEDEDGVQDANENPLVGVEVGLYQNGQLLATTHTDATGHYLFTDVLVEKGIKPRTQYELRVPTSQGSFTNLRPTSFHQSSNVEIDNDAELKDGYALIKLETTAPGENLHHLDFGFICTEKPQVAAHISCVGDVAILTLTGNKPTDHVDLVKNRVYLETTKYDQASEIPQTGELLRDQQVNWPDDLTIRVFNASGYYSDVFVKRTDAIGCDQSVAKEGEEVLVVSPNPASDYVNIRYQSKNQEGAIHLLLTDIEGRPILEQKAELKGGVYQKQFNFSHQPAGSYIIAIQDGIRKISKTVIKR